MIKKLFLTIILLIFISQVTEKFVQESQESYQFENESAQNQLIIELTANDVEFQLNGENRIFFSPRDREQVYRASKKVAMLADPTTIAIGYLEPEYTDLFEKKLKNAGIDYSEKIYNGQRQLELSFSDKSKWEPIKKEVDELLIRTFLLKGELNSQVQH